MTETSSSISQTTKRPADTEARKMSEEHLENKKQKVANEEPQLSAKIKKKASRARKLGLKYTVNGDEIIVQPKIFFKQFNDFASMKDARNLMLSTITPGAKKSRLAEIPDFPDVEPVKKVVMLDIPLFDPLEMKLPMEARQVSMTECPEVYQSFKSKPIYKYIQQSENEGKEILGLVSAAGFDQYKRVHDRFLDLLEVPLTKGEIKKRREEEDKDPEAANAIIPDVLIMTLETLKMEDFPIPSVLDPESLLEEGWVDTLPGTQKLENKKLVALDCEMCKTVNGYAVTRVALIDRDHKVLINELVKPAEEITDYVTHISGVDEQSLVGVETTLADIQKKLQQYIDSDTILVGHGLVNDMKVLKMRHPYIIDTSIIYHHKNGPPYKPSLRDLTTRYLKRTIQVRDEDKEPGEEKGHDPCEDAIASLELVERKLRYGLQYGLSGLSQVESVLDFLKRGHQTGAIIECNAELNLLMKRNLMENTPEDYHSVTDDEALIEKVIECHKDKQMIIARFNLPQTTEEERESKFMEFFERLYEKMDRNTAYCITTGYRKNKRREELREKRVEYKKKLKRVGLTEIPMEERWSIEDEHLLEQIADESRRGFIFASIKN